MTPEQKPELPWRDGGVYLITGGAGGLGLIFAREIAMRVSRPTIVLTGRSEFTTARREDVRAIQGEAHAHVEYRIMDVTDEDAVRTCVRSIAEEFGALHGIVHSAGVLRDSLVVNKTSNEFAEVLAPKVAGTLHLDRATQDMGLDCFIVFSSISALFGNVGQSDYACANGWMDGYAEYRNELVRRGERRGHTISLAWPLWEDGGMQVDPDAVERMRRGGAEAMATADGIKALYDAWYSGESQVTVLCGEIEKLKETLGATKNLSGSARERIDTRAEEVDPDKSEDPGREAGAGVLRRSIETSLIDLISEQLRVPVLDVDVEAELTEFGFDSISFTAFGNRLNQLYGLELVPTLFFEYPTVRKLAQYLSSEHAALLSEKLDASDARRANELGSKSGGSISRTDDMVGARTAAKRRDHAGRTRLACTGQSTREPVAIAIVGMSGRFPGARDIDEFWDNLRSGKDSITEIPSERWDWRAIYGNPTKDENRTNIKWGGFIEGVDEFDPLFFGISPREAELMDPQQRLLMMYGWKAIEDAGYSAESLSGSRTGIFVATGGTGYGELVARSTLAIEGHSSTGTVPSIGPNRLSYFLDWHGPSEPIETACSSSLVAMHRAVRAIQSGDCEQALVGGINTLVTPWLHVSFSKAGMLSEDGRCKAFSKDANGYVRGEGVGMLFLKKRVDAERDRDHIYALILGTAENHGGRAASLTAPNPQAQQDLIEAAYRAAQIDPRTVTYVEAHGTGTALGDPIELKGLQSAFESLVAQSDRHDDMQARCGIASVKSNIGHLELAAGAAGVIKVLLQMKHRTLVKSLHCGEVNPYIDLHDSPFYIVRETQPWIPLQDRERRPVPLRAGVSSFGFGGVNAHVLLEEYSAPDARSKTEDRSAPTKPAMIVLSAKTEERLRAQAQQLLRHLESVRYEHADDLASIAFTLQVGRTALEHRLALIALTLDELKEKLGSFVRSRWKDGVANCYRGEIKPSDRLQTEEAPLPSGTSWTPEQYAELVQLWSRGGSIDWKRLYLQRAVYADINVRRLSLPTYPFDAVKYSMHSGTELHRLASTQPLSTSSKLHPLLQRNTSDLSEQRFSTQFTGEEFYLKDHVVTGRRILPGVAYLEMARAAVERSVGDAGGLIELQDVVWLRPIVVNQRSEVHIGLAQLESGAIEFEIYSRQLESDAKIAHAQGRARVGETTASALRIDVERLRQGCDRTVEAEDCYRAFSALGVEYGPAHRGLRSVESGTGLDGGAYVIARVQLPDNVSGTSGEYVLHPSVLDCALQASLGLMMTSGTNLRFMLPFALERLVVAGPLPASTWVLVKHSSLRNEGARNLEISLSDESGHVCVQLYGLVLRAESDREAQSDASVMTLTPEWQVQALDPSSRRLDVAQHWVVLDRIYKDTLDELKIVWPRAEWCLLPEGCDEISFGTIANVGQTVLACTKSLIEAARTEPKLLQVIIGSNEKASDPKLAIAALLKTAHLESTNLVVQLICLSPAASARTIAQAIEENCTEDAQQDAEIRYGDAGREVRRMVELKRTFSAQNGQRDVPWKDGGVYLVVGGAGRLGALIVREIARHVSGAKIVIAGRSAPTLEQFADVDGLTTDSRQAHIEYRCTDVTNEESVRLCISSILERHGHLDGLVHCAGVIHDNLLINKSAEEFRSVLAPKIEGAINLDRATREMDLDFFLLFSSVAAALGNVGQSDYAFANAFLDQFAQLRSERPKRNGQQSRTLSINWPLWMDGGMQVGPATLQRLRREGFDTLETSDGIACLYEAWRSHRPQVVILVGDRTRLMQIIGRATPRTKIVRADHSYEHPPATVPKRELHKAIVEDLRHLVASALKLSPDAIETDQPLEEYGFDSFLAIRLTSELEHIFGPLSKTLLFEHHDIEALAEYFSTNHTAIVMRRLRGPSESTDVRPALSTTNPLAERSPKFDRRSRSRSLVRRQHVQDGLLHDPFKVAIVGLSGRYPNANNVHELWENLKAGKDCVSEIPASRWDYHKYYDAEKGVPGKSHSKWGGFIAGVEEFDPLFFNISPLEARFMDPQERLFLQCVYETLEDAGYTRGSLHATEAADAKNHVGVFVGVMYEEYQLYGVQAHESNMPYALSGNPSSIANRVSYFCDFRGPSIAVDTMCSSSLTAVHLAIQSMKAGSCRVAIAGGTNVSVHPNKYLLLSQGQFVSTTGRCESFGRGGDGYVPGEGIGAVLLKPLEDAVRDGDHIYGVIRGTAINHGGRANGFTVPNLTAQAEVIESALREAQTDPRTISYVEAHGTGTKLGDPIEIAGLTKAFSADPAALQYCSIGSVKSNIGHLEAAAGIAGLTKVLLQFKHRMLVPSLHSDELNPYIDFASTPFKVQREVSDWKRPVVTIDGSMQEYPRIAGVSSFGAGGSNAHVIVEEYMTDEEPGRIGGSFPEDPVMIVLSAKSEEQLREQIGRLVEYAGVNHITDSDLVNVGYTLQVGREPMEYRVAVTARSTKDVCEKLGCYLRDVDRFDELAESYRGRADKRQWTPLTSDDDVQRVIESLLDRGKFARVLELWVKGVHFDWAAWHLRRTKTGVAAPKRISLPTYPFVRDRYWVTPVRARASNATFHFETSSPRTGESSESLARLRLLLGELLTEDLDVASVAEQAKQLLGVRS